MEQYQQIGHASPEWETLLQRERINLLLLSAGGQSQLVKDLASSLQWCEQYRDRYALIFSRCEPIQ
jgi:hypothetical protein